MTSHRPSLLSVSPTAIVGGTVRIFGLRLSDASAVSIGGTPADSFAVHGDSQITAVVAGGTTSGRVAVTTPLGVGTSARSVTIVTAAPTLTLFTPLSGHAGDTITVTGTHLTGVSAVHVGGVSATFTVVSDTVLTLRVPASAGTGKITVTGPIGTATSPATFTYVPLPVITAFTPETGPTSTALTITGTGFSGASAVTVGGTPVSSFTVINDTTITATVAGGTATGAVAVTNTNGTATSTDTFIVLAGPSITSFTPGTGAIGSSVTITGTGFSGATRVTFNGIPAQFGGVTSVSITATVPDGVTAGHIAVTARGQVGTSAGTFTPILAPSIDYITPSNGVAGDTITVIGAGLTGVTAISIGGVACTGVVVDSDNSVHATVAALTPSGTVTVTSPAGTDTSLDVFTIAVVPSGITMSPTSGQVGASITVTGVGFVGVTDVEVNGVDAPFAVLSPTSIQLTVPAGATTGHVSVTNAVGTGTSAGNLTVPAGSAPTVTSLTPDTGPAGTPVVIAGTAFTGATQVSFNGKNPTSFTVDSAIQITAVTAAGTTTGPVSVTTAGGTGTSGGNFTPS